MGPGDFPWELAMHLAGMHSDPVAIGRRHEENVELHWQEHHLPGGIRHHEDGSIAFDEREVESSLEEAEAEEDRWGDQLYRLPVPGELASWCARLTEGNRDTVMGWLWSRGIASDWSPQPPRLSFGTRLGTFCIPPGWWVVAEGKDAEGISEEELERRLSRVA